MASTTSTFILRFDSEVDIVPEYKIKGISAPSLTIDDMTDEIRLINTTTSAGVTRYIAIDSYDTVDDLLYEINNSIRPDGYIAELVDGKIHISADFPFTWETTTSTSMVTLGMIATAALLTATKVSSTTNSATFEVPFYPPDTISDRNVFMTLTNVVVNSSEVSEPITDYIPFMISILDLPQSVGTFSDTNSEDCTRATQIGMVQTNLPFVKGPAILTHIPDGLQRICFRIDQVSNGLTQSLQYGTVFALMIQFDVTGIR